MFLCLQVLQAGAGPADQWSDRSESCGVGCEIFNDSSVVLGSAYQG